MNRREKYHNSEGGGAMPQEFGRLVGMVRKVVVGDEQDGRVRTSNLTRRYM